MQFRNNTFLQASIRFCWQSSTGDTLCFIHLCSFGVPGGWGYQSFAEECLCVAVIPDSGCLVSGPVSVGLLLFVIFVLLVITSVIL